MNDNLSEIVFEYTILDSNVAFVSSKSKPKLNYFHRKIIL
jgi:hypothetical protein